jgi:hypothetical protein
VPYDLGRLYFDLTGPPLAANLLGEPPTVSPHSRGTGGQLSVLTKNAGSVVPLISLPLHRW